MRIQKSRMRCVGIFLAVVICFFALQQSYGAQNMHDITQAEPDHLAVHTMERQQGSFLDILGRSELTQFEQARLTVSARITRLNAERNIILWAGLASGFASNFWNVFPARPKAAPQKIAASMRGRRRVLIVNAAPFVSFPFNTSRTVPGIYMVFP